MIPSALLSLALLVGPERQITEPDLAPQTGPVYSMDAASDGDGWLVVRGAYGAIANRIDRNGDLIDQAPIAVGGRGAVKAAVAWGDGAYLVAWGESGAIRAAFIDPSGNRSPSILVSSNVHTAIIQQIACAFDGSRFAIVWSEDPLPSHSAFYRTKFAAVLDPSGGVIATDISLGDGLPDSYFALAAGKGEFLVATNINGTLVGITVDDDGDHPLRFHDLGAHGSSGRPPFAAFNGSDYLLLWDRSGSIVRSNGTIVPISPLDSPVTSLTAIGQRYIATTAVAGELRASVIDGDGERQTMPVATAPDHIVSTSTTAWNGRALFIPYIKVRIGSGSTYAKFVDASGALVDPSAQQRRELLDPAAPGKVVALAPEAQTSPSIASADDHHALIVWSKQEEASNDYVTRAIVLRDGVPAGQPVGLGPGGPSSQVAGGASIYLVVTTTRLDSTYHIEGRRVALDGRPIDAAPFPILNAETALPATVAFDGENFVIAAAVYPELAGLGRVVAVRVRPDGTVLDPEGIVVFAPAVAPRLFNAPIIGSNGEGSIIMWRHGTDLLASALSRGGAPDGTVTVAHLVDVQPSVAWTGTSYVVAWTDIFAHALRWTALDTAASPAGSPGALPLAAANPIDPTAVARLGDGVLIAWADIATPSNTDIRALRVAADGSQQGDPFLVAGSELAEYAPVATGGEANVRFAYQRGIEFPGTLRWPRVFTRSIEQAPSPRKRAAR
jgi:hypothetical protein